MPRDMAAVTYFLPEPFDATRQIVWNRLTQVGLRVLQERDLSAWFQKTLGVRLARCHVLYVCSKYSEFAAASTSAEAGILLPVHIVVAERGRQTEIHVPSFLPIDDSAENGQLAGTLYRLRTELSTAFEGVAMQRGCCS